MDGRDLRDPQYVGAMLLVRNRIDHPRPSVWADEVLPTLDLPDYPKHDSVGSQTVREYRRELEQRAREGDRYAASMLKGIPYDEPGDET